MQENALITSLERAFDAVPRSDISLRQFQLTDRHGMDDDFPQQAWMQAGKQRSDLAWQAISDAELDTEDLTLPHMAADELRYFLPAYLRHVLRHLAAGAGQSAVAHMTLASLTPPLRPGPSRDARLGQYAALNEAQQLAVIRVLVFLADSDEVDIDIALQASQALDNYWRQALAAPDNGS